jgi:hypothetical protein
MRMRVVVAGDGEPSVNGLFLDTIEVFLLLLLLSQVVVVFFFVVTLLLLLRLFIPIFLSPSLGCSAEEVLVCLI